MPMLCQCECRRAMRATGADADASDRCRWRCRRIVPMAMPATGADADAGGRIAE